MSFQEKMDVRVKALGECVQPEVRDVLAQLFDMLPLTSTTS